MNPLNNSLNLLWGDTSGISLAVFIPNLFITTLLGWLLGLLYAKFGISLSNRKMLTTTLLLISLTTMIIISVVQSSLALSLGLVGALSIVRLRTAIKEPEELAYFFIAISLGIGMALAARLDLVLQGHEFIQRQPLPRDFHVRQFFREMDHADGVGAGGIGF